MKIQFIGATDTVTGSKHLLITESGKRILLDCGLFQGLGKDTDKLNAALGFDAAGIDAVILSHGHVDHCGNLPGMVKQGFKGKIYSTPATKDVCSVLLLDCAHIQESDAAFNRGRKKGSTVPLYTVADAEQCLEQFETIPFDTDFKLNDELSFYFSENGHVIGSGAINITAKETNRITRLTFTGDIGRYGDALLKDPAVFQQADYIICESTYGDKLHESAMDIEARLLQIMTETCVEKQGKLIIPAFSLGRTQEILFVFDKLANKKLLPPVNVYVDSPMSTKATAILRNHSESYNAELEAYIKKDPDPFGFPLLTYVQEASESRQLYDMQEPCVIISSSGMADAGRIQHHLCYTINEEKHTVLFTGYCSHDSVGGKLMRGEKDIYILDSFFEVKAAIEAIHSLSAHGDYKDMMRYLSCQQKSVVKGIFLVHGEHESKQAFSKHLKDEGYKNITVPKRNEIYELA
jgi:metallo-beta-lactamase family protein